MAKATSGKAGKKPGSTLAGIESRATTESATATASKALKTGSIITGQGLYTAFLMRSKEDETRMNIIRNMAASMDAAQVVAVVKDFKAAALKHDEEAWTASGAKGKMPNFKSSKTIGANYKAASNSAAGIQRVYGAIVYAEKELTGLGFSDATGWIQAQAMAGIALDRAGVKWDGSKAEDKESRAARAALKLEEKAETELRKANPRQAGEEFTHYQQRIAKLMDKGIQEQRKAERAKLVEQRAEELAKLDAEVRQEIFNKLAELVKDAEQQGVTVDELLAANATKH